VMAVVQQSVLDRLLRVGGGPIGHHPLDDPGVGPA